MLTFSEYFTVETIQRPAGSPVAVESVKLGTAGIIVENIDSLYAGPDTRGQDIPRVYTSGSFPGLRVPGDAEYTLRLVVSGETDAQGNPPAGGVSRREQAHRNLDALKKLGDAGVGVPTSVLRWYGRPGVPAPFIEASVFFPYSVGVRAIGQDHFRVTLTARNPDGYWLDGGAFSDVITLAAGTFSTGFTNFTIGGNIETTQVQAVLKTFGGETEGFGFTCAQTGTGLSYAGGSFSPSGPPFTDVLIDVRQRFAIETADFPSSVSLPADIAVGRVGYGDRRWLALSPGINNIISANRRGTGTATLQLVARGAYV